MLGFTLPIIRSLWFSMPPIYPSAISMAFELSVYGFLAGFIYYKLKKQNVWSVYLSILPAMLGGRAVWAVAQAILLGISGSGFTWKMFASGAFLSAFPGIALQLVLIPTVMSVLNASGVIKYKNET